MKALKTLLGMGLVSALAVGCTITTDSDDDDDISIIEDDEVSDETDDDDSDEDAGGDDDTDDTDDDETSEQDAGDDDSDDEDAGGDDDTDDDGTSEEDAAAAVDYVCEDNTDGDDVCEACLATSCCEEREACAEDADCSTEWDTFLECMVAADLGNVDNPDVADPTEQVAECAAVASPNENPVEMSPLLSILLECANMDVAVGDAGLEEGQCTQACYGVFTVQTL